MIISFDDQQNKNNQPKLSNKKEEKRVTNNETKQTFSLRTYTIWRYTISRVRRHFELNLIP